MGNLVILHIDDAAFDRLLALAAAHGRAPEMEAKAIFLAALYSPPADPRPPARPGADGTDETADRKGDIQ
jgi:plasmid stability protein